LFKLLNEEGVWQELIHNKYICDKTLAQVQVKPTDSPFWKGLMRVKKDFFNRGHFSVGSGRSVRFWEDVWLGDVPLAIQYPSLFNIMMQKKNICTFCFIPYTFEYWLSKEIRWNKMGCLDTLM
jgi:hypothetical protein